MSVSFLILTLDNFIFLCNYSVFYAELIPVEQSEDEDEDEEKCAYNFLDSPLIPNITPPPSPDVILQLTSCLHS